MRLIFFYLGTVARANFETIFENGFPRLLNLYSCCCVWGDSIHNPKKPSDVTTILVAFLQQFWLALWALVLLLYLLINNVILSENQNSFS